MWCLAGICRPQMLKPVNQDCYSLRKTFKNKFGSKLNLVVSPIHCHNISLFQKNKIYNSETARVYVWVWVCVSVSVWGWWKGFNFCRAFVNVGDSFFKCLLTKFDNLPVLLGLILLLIYLIYSNVRQCSSVWCKS